MESVSRVMQNPLQHPASPGNGWPGEVDEFQLVDFGRQ
jgi:hypothetical protein